jgi:hypothetical protein
MEYSTHPVFSQRVRARLLWLMLAAAGGGKVGALAVALPFCFFAELVLSDIERLQLVPFRFRPIAAGFGGARFVF